MKPIVTLAFATMLLASCASNKGVIPYEQFLAKMDSIGNSRNVKIWVQPNQYKAFGITEENLADGKMRFIIRSCSNPGMTYAIEFFSPNNFNIQSTECDKFDAYVASYNAKEKLRDKKSNRVSWKEFRTRMLEVDPECNLIDKKTWKKQRMLRSELDAAINRHKKWMNLGKTSSDIKSQMY